LRLKHAEPKGLVIITIAVWRSCATSKKRKRVAQANRKPRQPVGFTHDLSPKKEDARQGRTVARSILLGSRNHADQSPSDDRGRAATQAQPPKKTEPTPAPIAAKPEPAKPPGMPPPATVDVQAEKRKKAAREAAWRHHQGGGGGVGG
jgi:FtsZ-interacting cell division protein ZipA